MRGPNTDAWLDGITQPEADAWLAALRKIHDPVPPEPRPVTDHLCGPDGYCTGCPEDIPWLGCPVWAEQPTGVKR